MNSASARAQDSVDCIVNSAKSLVVERAGRARSCFHIAVTRSCGYTNS